MIHAILAMKIEDKLLYGSFIIMLFYFLRSVANPDVRRLFNDHVMFISGTLGTGKTSIIVKLIDKWLNPYSTFDKFLSKILGKPLKAPPTVYTTFECKGCVPLDIRAESWPLERGCKVVIDEFLLLDAQDLIRKEWFSYGCTLARQLGQQVIIISQDTRLPERFRKFRGTIGTWFTLKGFSFGSRGRLVLLKRSSEPFVRRTKGYNADGMKKSLIWIPGNIYGQYKSNKIYGYTCELDGSPTVMAFAHVSEVQAQQGGAAHVIAAGERGARADLPKPKRVHRVKRAV